MVSDTFFRGRVRLGQSFLLICGMASGLALAAEGTYNCIPMQGGANSIESMSLNALPPAPSVNMPNTADNFYIVQKGDTLYAIMRKSGVPIENLIVLNQLSSLNNLKAGQSLRLPDLAQPLKQPEIIPAQPVTLPNEITSIANTDASSTLVDRYVVRVGDTLYAISRKTGVSIERLISLNQLDSPNSLNAGRQLRLR